VRIKIKEATHKCARRSKAGRSRDRPACNCW